MIKQLLSLEWKAFWRSAAMQTNLFMKIIMIFWALYFIVVLGGLGFGLYFILKEQNLDPINTVSKFAIYYFAGELFLRHFFQKMPILNIRALIYQNIKKNQIVNYAIGKTVLSFFNFMHWFFFIPFTLVLLINYEASALQILGFGLSLFLIIYILNFVNILLENNDKFFYIFATIIISVGALDYYQIFKLTDYSQVFFKTFFQYPWLIFGLIGLIYMFYKLCYKLFYNNLYLDAGLAIKQEEAKLQNLNFLDKYGNLGSFLKNDIRLILRNKRARTTVGLSIFFIFYGFLIGFKADFMHIFIGIFVTGGFLFSFGQYVPSWDSSYYPFMMTQNIQYREYLQSKWWLIVMATIISTLLCTIYLTMGWHVYLAILAGAVYNIGINAYVVLIAGAYTRSPIDLTSNKNAFADKKAFNLKTMLLTLPKLLLPIIIYALGSVHSHETGLIVVMLFGVFGIIFKEKAFQFIENLYKKEKHITLAAYKEK